jgi:hypothetical protein
MDELERYVLSELAAGRTPSEIVRARQHVTLADVQRIRDLDVHLSGAFTVHPDEALELRQLLDLDVVDGASLVRRVRDVVTRVEMLAMRVTNTEAALARSTRALPPAAPDQTGDRDVPHAPSSSKKVS